MREAKKSSGRRPSIRRAVSDALIEEGYRRKYGMHIRAFNAEFSTVVDTGPRDGYGDIVPWVGLRHESVERLTSELMGLPDTGYTGTVGANAGIILGSGYRRWLDPGEVSEVLSNIYRALDVLAGYASLDRLPDAWAINGMTTPSPYTKVSTYLLMHDPQMFEQALKDGQLRECTQEDEVCAQFRRFEKRARARFARPT